MVGIDLKIGVNKFRGGIAKNRESSLFLKAGFRGLGTEEYNSTIQDHITSTKSHI